VWDPSRLFFPQVEDQRVGLWVDDDAVGHRVVVPRRWSHIGIPAFFAAVIISKGAFPVLLAFLVQLPFVLLHPRTYEVSATETALEVTSGLVRRHILWSDIAAFGCFERRLRRPMTFWPFRELHAVGIVVLHSGDALQLPGLRSAIDRGTGIGTSSCWAAVESFRRYASNLSGWRVPLATDVRDDADWVGRPYQCRWW
jgi:hypothetical protein